MATDPGARRKECLLLRSWYKTDMTAVERDYHGALSDPFPPPTPDQQLISADWSETGWVQVTWLITRDAPDPTPRPAGRTRER